MLAGSQEIMSVGKSLPDLDGHEILRMLDEDWSEFDTFLMRSSQSEYILLVSKFHICCAVDLPVNFSGVTIGGIKVHQARVIWNNDRPTELVVKTAVLDTENSDNARLNWLAYYFDLYDPMSLQKMKNYISIHLEAIHVKWHNKRRSNVLL